MTKTHKAWLRKDGTLKKQVLRTIVHECGHATLAWRLGWQLGRMFVNAESPNRVLGRFEAEQVPSVLKGHGTVPRKDRRVVEEAILIYAAGGMAVALWGKTCGDAAWSRWPTCEADAFSMMDLIHRLNLGAEANREEYYRRKAKALLAEPATWAALQRLIAYVESAVSRTVRNRFERSPERECKKVVVCPEGMLQVLEEAVKDPMAA